MPQNQNARFWNLVTECLAGTAVLAAITFVCFHLRLAPLIPACLYLIALMLLSLRGSLASAVIVSFVAAGCLDYYFLPPIFAFTIGSPGNVLTVATFLGTATALARLVSNRHRLLQEKLDKGEAYLSEAQRLSQTGSFGWKVTSGELVWSDETFRIFQYDRTITPTLELILQRVHPQDRDFVQRAVVNVSPDANDFNIEHRLLMPDGSVKHLSVVAHARRDHNGKTEFIGAVMDVTVAKEAADKIRLTINTVPGLLWTARPDGWVDFLSQRWLDYTGMSLEQGLGWAWQPGYHPDDLGNVLRKWRTAIAEGKPLEVEARLRRFDGEYRWFLKRAFPLFDQAGHVLGWYGGNIDVHDLKQVEEKLRRIETYLIEGQRLSRTGSWAWSVQTNENLYWSRESYRIFGFDPDTESGQYEAAHERIHPADRAAFDEALAQAIKKQGDFVIDFRIVLPGREMKYVHNLGHPVFNSAGKLVEYIGTTVDITEQVKARAALEEAYAKIKQSEASLRTIIDAIPTLAWSLEADGSVDFVNLRWRQYTGLSTAEAQGSGWEAAIHPDDVRSLLEHRRSAVASGKAFELESRLRRHDGQYRWFINRGDPLLDEHGKIAKWYGTNTDIDDRKRAEEALRRAQADLTHVTRITTLGELTASIAHEVNQPLTAVVNNANACINLLANSVPDLAEIRQTLAEIIEDADRASEVVARVRQLVKKAPIEKSRLDLRDVIRKVLTLSDHESVARHVTILSDLSADLPAVSGDSVQLQQVLFNLIINGMDAMNQTEASKRVITICGRRETHEDTIAAQISVRDSGVGFELAELNRLFEAFYTTKSQGMGMGLAISRSIIDAHGGRLWAKQNDGPGATFLFILPAAPEQKGKDASTAGPPAS